MKITVNGKKHELGKASGRTECKVSYERLAVLAGFLEQDCIDVSFKNKSGLSGTLTAGQKCVAPDGTVFSVVAIG